MKTTLVIDDELYRRVKVKAALEGRTVTELVEIGLRAALSAAPEPRTEAEGRRRVRLPVVASRPHQPVLFAGMSQEEIHQRLAELQLADDQAHAAPPA